MTSSVDAYFAFMARFREEQIAEGKLPAVSPEAAWRAIIDDHIAKGKLRPRSVWEGTPAQSVYEYDDDRDQ